MAIVFLNSEDIVMGSKYSRIFPETNFRLNIGPTVWTESAGTSIHALLPEPYRTQREAQQVRDHISETF